MGVALCVIVGVSVHTCLLTANHYLSMVHFKIIDSASELWLVFCGTVLGTLVSSMWHHLNKIDRLPCELPEAAWVALSQLTCIIGAAVLMHWPALLKGDIFGSFADPGPLPYPLPHRICLFLLGSAMVQMGEMGLVQAIREWYNRQILMHRASVLRLCANEGSVLEFVVAHLVPLSVAVGRVVGALVSLRVLAISLSPHPTRYLGQGLLSSQSYGFNATT